MKSRLAAVPALEVPRRDRYACGVLMAKDVSKTQIDRLGNHLKSGNITEDDLRLLDQYRRSFTDAYEAVVRLIRDKLGLEPTGRVKSTTSNSRQAKERKSEKFSDKINPSIKYGGGDSRVQGFLQEAVNIITAIEARERELIETRTNVYTIFRALVDGLAKLERKESP